MVGLADCNSFYASCEKLFRPDLRNSPVVVLSNNDGCIVALSKEAKELGIKRGEVYFKCKEELARKGVAVFSSNYTLYQDISERTVSLLKEKTPSVEPYSIDESFFTPAQQTPAFAAELHSFLLKNTGLMISVGIGRTKTLAKIANHIGKKAGGHFFMGKEDEEEILKKTAAGEVWGVGRSAAKKLMHNGINSAYDLMQLPDLWIKKTFSVNMLKTVSELRGIPCIGAGELCSRSFVSGISFATPKTGFDEVMQSLSCHSEVLSRKLALKGLLAGGVFIQVFNSRFNGSFVFSQDSMALSSPSCYAPDISACAGILLQRVFINGVRYKGSRVGVFDLCLPSARQYSLFSAKEREADRKKDIMAQTALNIPSLHCLGSGGIKKGELCLSAHRSPCYTTRWDSLPEVF